MIMKTMHEIRTVSPTAARNLFRESFYRARQIASPPIIPRISIRYQYCYFLDKYDMG
jgi:hypothetical protein